MQKPTRKHEWKDQYTLLCERCGYILEDLDQALPCPECGKPISESLPFNRSGTPWQQESNIRFFLATLKMTLLHQNCTLKEMRFHRVHPKEQAIFNISVATAIIVVSFIIFYIMNIARIIIPFTFTIVTMSVFIWGFLWTLTAIEAKGLQFFSKRKGKRITKEVAWVIVAHGSAGWILAAAGISAAFLIVSVNLALSSPDPNGALSISYTTAWVALFIATAFPLAGFLFFEIFAYLGHRRCKYANRPRPSQHTKP